MARDKVHPSDRVSVLVERDPPERAVWSSCHNCGAVWSSEDDRPCTCPIEKVVYITGSMTIAD
jgi:hypothetical protein